MGEDINRTIPEILLEYTLVRTHSTPCCLKRKEAELKALMAGAAVAPPSAALVQRALKQEVCPIKVPQIWEMQL